MIFLPIVERELRVGARRKQTYHGRLVMAFVAVAVAAGSVGATMSRGFSSQAGVALFTGVAGMTAMFCLFSGAGTTADSLSGEKREGTLGLLFLTDLKAYDIVLGKFVACTLMSFYGILAMLPVLALGVVLGGVPMGQVVRTSAALVNALFFSAALGLLISSLARKADQAGGAAMVLVLCSWMGSGLLARGLDHLGVLPWLAWALRATSPQSAVEMATGTLSGRSMGLYWSALAGSHAMGWLFLGVTCVVLPRVWQDRPANKEGLPWAERWAQRRLGVAEARVAYRWEALGINPFYWLCTREFRRPRQVWWFLGLIVGGFVVLTLGFYGTMDRMGSSVFVVVILHLVLRLWVAGEAGRRLAEDRQAGTLELILSTPIRVEEILGGHWRSMRRMFLGPLVGVALIDLGLLAFVIATGALEEDKQLGTSLMLAGALLKLFLDPAALSWVALWAALSEKRPQVFGYAAVSRVMILPWMVVFGLMMTVALLTAGGGPGPPISGAFMTVLYFGLSTANSVFWLVRCRRKLLREFRVRATERFLEEEEKPGLWARAWGKVKGIWKARGAARLTGTGEVKVEAARENARPTELG